MTRLEKLKAVQSAYYALIPGLKNISVPDYELVLTTAPNLLNEMIDEEAADATRELLAKEKETKTCGQ